MALIACPNPACYAANSQHRKICRECGTQLGATELGGAGRITFDVRGSHMVNPLKLLADAKDVCAVPVLFDGKDVGIKVHIIGTNYTRDLFDDAKIAVLGALIGGRRARKA